MKTRLTLSLAFLLSTPAFAANMNVRLLRPNQFFVSNNSQLRATFTLECNQTFLEVVRHDLDDPATGMATIAVAGLVSENRDMNCAGSSELDVQAGFVYSGRPYTFQRILIEGEAGS